MGSTICTEHRKAESSILSCPKDGGNVSVLEKGQRERGIFADGQFKAILLILGKCSFAFI